jgi:hypothetical protein
MNYNKTWIDDILINPGARQEFELSLGQVYGRVYHCARPIGWCDWSEIETWCTKTYGPSGDIWVDKPQGQRWEKVIPRSRYYLNDGRAWFCEESDLTLFLLKWS